MKMYNFTILVPSSGPWIKNVDKLFLTSKIQYSMSQENGGTVIMIPGS